MAGWRRWKRHPGRESAHAHTPRFSVAHALRAQAEAHGPNRRRSGEKGISASVPLGTSSSTRRAERPSRILVRRWNFRRSRRPGRTRQLAPRRPRARRAPTRAQRARIGGPPRAAADRGRNFVGFPTWEVHAPLRLSAARLKIADYAFTTLEPYLGLVRVHEEDSFVRRTSLPIEGPSGKGLGASSFVTSGGRGSSSSSIHCPRIPRGTRSPKRAPFLSSGVRQTHDRSDEPGGSVGGPCRRRRYREDASWGGAISGVTGEGTQALKERIWSMLARQGETRPDADPWNAAGIKE